MQPLPNKQQPAENHMTRVMCNISESSSILSDPVVSTNELIIDSGCTDHMFNTNVQLTNYSVLPQNSRTVTVANGLLIPVLGVGSCGFLQQVYYVPDLSHSLLSVRSLASDGCQIIFEKDKVVISPELIKANLNYVQVYPISHA